MWYDGKGYVHQYKLPQFMSRSDAVGLLKRKLKNPNVITVTISLENDFVAEQRKTFEGPAYSTFFTDHG